MTNILFFDTETTGLGNSSKPHTDACQPLPVQLGLKIDDENRTEQLAANVMLRPEGRWTVEPGAFKSTGIDNARADKFGVHFITGCELFLDTVAACEMIVAHNIAYDIRVMRRAIFVYSQMTEQDYADPFEGKVICCTMHNSTALVKAPPFRKGSWKWPKLEECVAHFFDERLEGAHDALVDVRACARVYYHLIEIGAIDV